MFIKDVKYYRENTPDSWWAFPFEVLLGYPKNKP